MRYIALCILLATLSVGCKKEPKKDPNAVPPATQIGADRLACKINGKLEEFKGKSTYLSPDGLTFLLFTDTSSKIQYCRIHANKTPQDDKYISLWHYIAAKEIRVGIQYDMLNDKDKSSYSYRYAPTGKQDDFYYLDPSMHSYIIFTQLDNNIAAGKFEFHGISDDDSIDRVHITEGWFDISR